MRTCPNCGSERVEKYCPRCGQRFGSGLSLSEFFRDVADDQFGIDAKVPRTLRALFLKPGLLTTEYIAGRGVRYIPPFRLYLLTSVLFFVLLSFLSRRSDWAERAEADIRREMAGDTARAAIDSARGVGITIDGGNPWLDSVNVNLPWQWLDQKIEANLRALSKLPPSQALRRITEAVIEEIPKVMFILLPLFALLLKLFYFRRVRFYIEHFVFALHFHAFVYIVFCLALIIGSDWILLIPSIALPLYLLLAMKRVYQQSWWITTIKWLVLGYTYLVVLLLGLTFALVWALTAA